MSMCKVIKFNKEEWERRYVRLIEQEECRSFIAKMHYSHIPELVEASGQYGITFQNIEYTVICRKEEMGYDVYFYVGLDDSSKRYFQFNVYVETEEDMLYDYVFDLVEAYVSDMNWDDVIDEKLKAV